jgi:hypothetical protein
MRISASRRLEHLEDHLAICWGFADAGDFSKLEDAYKTLLLPVLKQVNKDFRKLEIDFARLRTQIERANKDARDISGLLKAFPPSKEIDPKS